MRDVSFFKWIVIGIAIAIGLFLGQQPLAFLAVTGRGIGAEITQIREDIKRNSPGGRIQQVEDDLTFGSCRLLLMAFGLTLAVILPPRKDGKRSANALRLCLKQIVGVGVDHTD